MDVSCLNYATLERYNSKTRADLNACPHLESLQLNRMAMSDRRFVSVAIALAGEGELLALISSHPFHPSGATYLPTRSHCSAPQGPPSLVPLTLFFHPKKECPLRLSVSLILHLSRLLVRTPSKTSALFVAVLCTRVRWPFYDAWCVTSSIVMALSTAT